MSLYITIPYIVLLISLLVLQIIFVVELRLQGYVLLGLTLFATVKTIETYVKRNSK